MLTRLGLWLDSSRIKRLIYIIYAIIGTTKDSEDEDDDDDESDSGDKKDKVPKRSSFFMGGESESDNDNEAILEYLKL